MHDQLALVVYLYYVAHISVHIQIFVSEYIIKAGLKILLSTVTKFGSWTN